MRNKKKYHPDWKNIRKYAIKRAFSKCSSCGILQHFTRPETGKKVFLQVHHNDGNLWNNKAENLTVLCPSCHMKKHNNLKRK